MRASLSHQRGAALIEMAIALPLFLTLVFAIIEFSVLLFNWSRVIDATRAGARYAIVSAPECPAISGLSCDPANPGATIPITCNPASESLLLAEMQKNLPDGMLEAGNVNISYSCTNAGFSERPTPVFAVTVSVTGLEHQFVTSGLFGVEQSFTLPDHAITRTSEDLYTPE